MFNQDGELIVGRDEAFYFNTLDGRGPCFACEGTTPSCSFTLQTCLTLQSIVLVHLTVPVHVSRKSTVELLAALHFADFDVTSLVLLQ